MYKQPMSVHHINFKRTDNFARLTVQAAASTHMSHGEAALLAFYGSCSTGFAPSAKLIAERIGRNEIYVYQLRKALAAKGIIVVIDNKIYVDWKRIRLLASLDPAKTCKAQFIRPQNTVVMDRIVQAQRINNKFLEAWMMTLDQLIVYFGAMTNAEYNAWRSGYKKYVAAL